MNKSKIILTEMLLQRGYTAIDDEDKVPLIFSKEGDLIGVFFHMNSKLNKKDFTLYLKIMNEHLLKHTIIVYSDSITSMMIRTIESNIDIDIELFSKNELQFNITKHILQPKYFISLSFEESNAFKLKYGSRFATIKTSDAISRFYNFKKGHVIEIEKQDGIVEYRIVK